MYRIEARNVRLLVRTLAHTKERPEDRTSGLPERRIAAGGWRLLHAHQLRGAGSFEERVRKRDLRHVARKLRIDVEHHRELARLIAGQCLLLEAEALDL